MSRSRKATPTTPLKIPSVLELLKKHRARYHELALKVPPMTQDEFERRVRHVRAVGQQDAIRAIGGKVVSGVYDDLACVVLGRKPRIEELPGSADLTHIIASEFFGRRLTAGQRAVAAVAFLPLVKRNRKAFAADESSGDPHKAESVTFVADLVGAGMDAVQSMLSVKRKSREVFKAVQTGEIRTVAEAMRRAGIRTAKAARRVPVHELVLRLAELEPSKRREVIEGLVEYLASRELEEYDHLRDTIAAVDRDWGLQRAGKTVHPSRS